MVPNCLFLKAGGGLDAEWGRGLEELGEPLLLALTWACVSTPLLVAFAFLVLAMLRGSSPNLIWLEASGRILWGSWELNVLLREAN